MQHLKNKFIFITLILILVGFVAYILYPKKYEEFKPSNLPEFSLPKEFGYSCACAGYKNERNKTCIGIIYSCYVAH